MSTDDFLNENQKEIDNFFAQDNNQSTYVGQHINHTIDEPLGRFSNAPSGLEHQVQKPSDEQ